MVLRPSPWSSIPKYQVTGSPGELAWGGQHGVLDRSSEDLAVVFMTQLLPARPIPYAPYASW